MAYFESTMILNQENIDVISEQLTSFMEQSGTGVANILRIRLSIEEALLRFLDHFPDDREIRVFIGRRFNQNEIHIEVRGPAFNPLVLSKDASENWSASLLSDIGISPHYSYSGQRNHLRLTLPGKHMNPVLKLLMCVALGVFFGFAGRALIQPAVIGAVIETFLDPFFDLWMRVLNLLCGPLIFILVLNTVLNLNTVDVQGGNKKRVILRYVLILILTGITVILTVRFFQPLDYQSSQIQTDDYAGFLDVLLGIVAEDMISPFVTVNTAQLVLMAVFIGAAINRLKYESEVVTSFIHQAYGIGLQLADWVSSAVPFFTVLLLTFIIWNGDVEIFAMIWQPFLLFVIFSIVLAAIMIFVVSNRYEVSVAALIEKLKKSFVTALKTGSMNDTFTYIENTCIKSLGIERNFARASLPSGLVLYMPSSLIELIVFSVYAARIYQVSAHFGWYFMLLFLTVVLSMASPPVAGVSLISFMTIFSQLGIPRPALIAGMIADIIFGVIAGAFNQSILSLDLVLQAGRIGLVNETKLRHEPAVLKNRKQQSG